MKRRIVLDTNCLIQCISRRNECYLIWDSFVKGQFILCVSNEIIEEYDEILSSHTNPTIAKLIIRQIIIAQNTYFTDTQFHFNLITADPDDNKFVDCAIAANAEYIVSNDTHFNVLKHIPFPKLYVLKMHQFYKILQENI